jgi:hypothetical protein
MFNFSRLRAPIRGRVAFAVSLPKAEFRTPFRRFSAEPPKPKKSSAPIWLAGAAVGGIAYYYYTTQIATNSGITVKPKAVFKPAKEDYQKVCLRIEGFSCWSLILLERQRYTTKLRKYSTTQANMMV